jgi:hypothetical protein
MNVPEILRKHSITIEKLSEVSGIPVEALQGISMSALHTLALAFTEEILSRGQTPGETAPGSSPSSGPHQSSDAEGSA